MRHPGNVPTLHFSVEVNLKREFDVTFKTRSFTLPESPNPSFATWRAVGGSNS